MVEDKVGITLKLLVHQKTFKKSMQISILAQFIEQNFPLALLIRYCGLFRDLGETAIEFGFNKRPPKNLKIFRKKTIWYEVLTQQIAAWHFASPVQLRLALDRYEWKDIKIRGEANN